MTYDAMGRIASISNPFTAGGTPSYWTTYQYDALGRKILVTLPDNNTVQKSYNGLTETVTDEVNRKIKRECDSLNRLVKVTEQDIATGNLTQETSYSYNLLDKLTNVNQGSQLRAWKYDDLGRMTYERIPEQTATINDSTGTFWTSKHTYTHLNAVQTRTDARGVITTNTYDTLNRLTNVSYNTSAAPNVISTPSVTYNYDNVSTSSSFGKLLSVQIPNGTGGYFYQGIYTYDSYTRTSTVKQIIDGKTYQTTHTYNQADQNLSLTYPSGASYTSNFDNKGRLSSINGVLSNITYDVAGQVTGMTMGNGVVETYGYDAQRLQLTSQTATKSGTTLLSLTYGYQAIAGQSGAGSTAGNSGQLTSISGCINGQTESTAYTYDNLSRLLTSNQTTNGTTAQRRFAYDRWGNRTSVYDALSGGTQIQSVSLQQSGGAPTNRLTSVTNNGTTTNYTYDNNGNVTNDGVHSYSYDAENRLVNADNGTTAQYGYDHLSRRVKKVIGSTITHYVWLGYQVIAEHNGSNGNVNVIYNHSGKKMVSKVENGSTKYFLSDRLSMRAVLDSNGNLIGRQSHLPFGEEIGGSGAQDKHHFTSYERDSEIATDYSVYREYNQSIGRFMRPDPFGGSYNFRNPQSFNRYAYTMSSPVNAIDTLGLFTICFWGIQEGVPWEDLGINSPGTTDVIWNEGCMDIDGGFGMIPANPPTSSPCLNDDGTETRAGFNQGISGDRAYNVEELNSAAATILGELSSLFTAQTAEEALAIASIILNRSERIRNNNVPYRAGWGENDNLTTVSSKFDGYAQGWRIYNSNVEFGQGDRNCDKLKAAGAALNWLANDPSARRPYLYMCARAWLHRDVDTANGEVQINNNVFSENPFGAGNRDCHEP